LHELVSTGASPETPQAQALAQRWIAMLLAETGGDEGLLMKLYDMHWNEPALHSLTGVDREGMRFISHAMAFARLQLYAPHCSDSEMATLRAHYVAQTDAWPPLIADVREQMLQGRMRTARPCARSRCAGGRSRWPRRAATRPCTSSCSTRFATTRPCAPARASTRRSPPTSGGRLRSSTLLLLRSPE
jgi:hypothetical protein